MLFSVLVANYNNGHFFYDCYQSIKAQTYKNWEIILVDDFSTDNSVDVIKEIIKGDKRVHLILNDRNRGCGYTKWKCAKHANGEIIGFVDPDDAITPEALEVMISMHRKNNEVSVITSKYELVDLNMNFNTYGAHGEPLPPDRSYLTFGKGALTHFASFKQSLYRQTIGINPEMKRAVDQDLYYKLEEVGKHLFIEKVLYRYRIHTNSISNNDNLFKAQYWHYCAILDAYKRRKLNNLKIDNYSRNQIKKIESEYLLGRFELIKHTSRFCSKKYFLLKSIISFPNHRLVYKIKSLLK